MQRATTASLTRTKAASISRMINRRAQSAANGQYCQFRDAIQRALYKKFNGQNPPELTVANWLAALTDADISALAFSESLSATHAITPTQPHTREADIT